MTNWKEYITIDPSIRFGKPTIKGTRISIADILNWMANGMSKEQIIDEYPELSESMIHAALFYSAARYEHVGFAT
jgi:uncharacterized protein (DUF433 family)